MLDVPFDLVGFGALLMCTVMLAFRVELDGLNDPTTWPIPGGVSHMGMSMPPVKGGAPRIWYKVFGRP
jgi:hypothetical protein